MKNIHLDKIKAALFGVATGDALGVPVEFKSRQSIAMNPVKEMSGYGTYNLAPGTWSDDSSMTFCLAESLSKGYDLQHIADTFAAWAYNGYWTPRGVVFDIGIGTSQALWRVKQGLKPELCGGTDEGDNGNGSLMRILPLLFYIKDRDIAERYRIIREVSSITHAHIRSVNACFYYLEFARRILLGEKLPDIYHGLKEEISAFFATQNMPERELNVLSRLLQDNIYERKIGVIRSNGYVISTLEASIWCLLTSSGFEATVLNAVNLGEDTDTTGAVTGGLAALYYGLEAIPERWINALARKEDIEKLSGQFFCFLAGK
ncbi:MAG: hypothetical protein BGO31_14995 [Bacteroidetes bacterium 43-16]|mgnify:CR=1 FL=1|nr:MAG: hypothetical protein BGO31_14995 [Bacteroidetes bacterium 43-16]